MFDSLTDRFEVALSKVRRSSGITEEELDDALREFRLALLEADVNLDVTKAFLDRVRTRVLSTESASHLSSGKEILKVVNEELVAILGGETFKFSFASHPPTIVLMAGLQGAGKTTATAKLARWLKSEGRNPLLIGADLQRPAAVEQLRVLGEQAGVSVFSEATTPVEVTKHGIEEARRLGKDVVIIDTAGRLSIDEEMMQQVRDISATSKPHFTFLVIDAMIGQEAVNTARAFHDSLALDAVILSKLDGDARGGAALSVKGVTGKPIAFASVGEKLADFEPFYPERMASRILGMGDIASLIEKAEANFDQDTALRGVEKLTSGQFDLDDFLQQMQQVKKLGSLSGLMKMMPGMPKELRNAQIEDSEITRVEAIIHSMTPAERRDPDVISAARRQRIARGSGRQLADVNMLLKQFADARKMMTSMMAPMASKNKTKKGKKGKGSRVTAKGTKAPQLGNGMPGGMGDFPGLDGFPGLDDLSGFPGLEDLSGN